MSFREALLMIDTDKQRLVELQLSVWDSGTCVKWGRIVRNIRSETALTPDHFASLLASFAEALTDGTRSPEDCWIASCREHQFRGQPMASEMPDLIGRALPIDEFARLAARTSGTPLTEAQMADLLRKVALDGKTANPREMRILRRALLGRYVIWATFHPTNPADSPFRTLPHTTECVRTALGLGDCSETETLILLTYSTATPGGTLELFRPTVGEAADYSWYCPHPDPSAPHGWTEPLQPNPLSLPRMPEVVHREIHGDTLVFPLYLAV